VEIMVTHPLVLPDEPLSLEALEATIHTWGRDLQRRAVAEAWQRQAALRSCVPCPTCRSEAVAAAGYKERQVETVFGSVRLRRARRQCQACGTHFQPDDAALGPAMGTGQCTPKVRELAAACGASWPYQQAAEVLQLLRGAPLAPETIRTIVARTGEALAAQHQAEAQAACQPPARAPARVVGPARLEVVVDGGWVRSRDNPEGMEIKVGVVHTGSAVCGRTRTRLPARRYAATAYGVPRFGPLLTAALDHLHGYEAPDPTWLGDGAAWIWRLRETVLAAATAVLDRWHLRDQRRRALRAALPDKAARAPWSTVLEAHLEAGAVEEALAVLAELAGQHPHPALTEFATYLRTQAPRIPNYAARRAAGQTIGNGVSEKGVDMVVNRRLKGKRGMRWWRQRADGVVALRVTQLNGEWDQRLPAALAHAA
jgi:hypothetical protein